MGPRRRRRCGSMIPAGSEPEGGPFRRTQPRPPMKDPRVSHSERPADFRIVVATYSLLDCIVRALSGWSFSPARFEQYPMKFLSCLKHLTLSASACDPGPCLWRSGQPGPPILALETQVYEYRGPR